MDNVIQTIALLFAMFVSGLTTYIIFDRKLKSKLQEAINALGEAFEAIFATPNVKKAFSILGQQGGEVRAERAVTSKIASDILNGPKFAGLKMAASALGLDIDAYIEEHGAPATIAALQQLGGMLGINIQDLMAGGIEGLLGDQQSQQQQGSNPYL